MKMLQFLIMLSTIFNFTYNTLKVELQEIKNISKQIISIIAVRGFTRKQFKNLSFPHRAVSLITY